MSATISLIKGDGIGVDVSDAAMTLVNQAIARCGLSPLVVKEINAGAAYFAETGMDIEPGGEKKPVMLTQFSSAPLVHQRYAAKMGPKYRRTCGYANVSNFLLACGQSKPLPMHHKP